MKHIKNSLILTFIIAIIIFSGFSAPILSADSTTNKEILMYNNWEPVAIDIDHYFYKLLISPANSQVIYAVTDSKKVYESLDGGGSWKHITVGFSGNVNLLVVDPKDTDTIYAGTDKGIFKTVDGGKNWINLNLSNKVVSMAIVPNDSKIIYAGTHNGGLFRTTDGGTNWHLLTSGLLCIYSIAINPKYSNILYIGTSVGVLRSLDFGNHWNSVNNGLTGNKNIESIAIDPDHPSVLYASSDMTYIINRPNFFKSSDGGSHWTSIGRGLPIDLWFMGHYKFSHIIVAPNNPDIIYVQANYDFLGIFLTGGIYRSIDGGAHWSLINGKLNRRCFLYPISVTAFALDQKDPQIIYMAADKNGYLQDIQSSLENFLLGPGVDFNSAIYKLTKSNKPVTLLYNVKNSLFSILGFTFELVFMPIFIVFAMYLLAIKIIIMLILITIAIVVMAKRATRL